MGASVIYIELEHGLPLMYRGRPILVEDWDPDGDVMISYADGFEVEVISAWELEVYNESG